MSLGACFNCGKVTDAAAPVSGESAPVAGDVSVCFYCAAISVFTGEGLATRQPTAEEREELLFDPAVTATVGGLLLFRAERPDG